MSGKLGHRCVDGVPIALLNMPQIESRVYSPICIENRWTGADLYVWGKYSGHFPILRCD